MTFHSRSDSVILRIENYTAGRRAERNWQECRHHASSKTYVWVSEMKQRGNRKPLFTLFSPQERWVWNRCLAARDVFHRLYSYSKCWHCGLYFWLSGTRVRHVQAFFLAHARLVLWWFAMNFTVQKCVRSNQVTQCNFGVNHHRD